MYKKKNISWKKREDEGKSILFEANLQNSRRFLAISFLRKKPQSLEIVEYL